ncbi:unnamed protein product [Phytomonas sp. EM1]|nr:unnamed protein product [Phytomonas sp. EM1]|eukprot:CCW63977.1 unnamed protein product [Phytomonas sp. isolate EM1]
MRYADTKRRHAHRRWDVAVVKPLRPELPVATETPTEQKLTADPSPRPQLTHHTPNVKVLGNRQKAARAKLRWDHHDTMPEVVQHRCEVVRIEVEKNAVVVIEVQRHQILSRVRVQLFTTPATLIIALTGLTIPRRPHGGRHCRR